MQADPQAPRIRTERLLLRPPTLADAVYIAELANDADVARMTVSIPHPYRLADAQAFLSAVAARPPRDTRPFLIEHPDFGPIGMTGYQRHPASGLMEVGYWLGRTFRGAGFATEALRGALRWAQLDWGRRAIVSNHFEDNPASARVLVKAGFLYTGVRETRFSLGRGQSVATRMMVWLA